MPGSRKGERRGGAKPGRVLKPAPKAKKSARVGKSKGGRPKGTTGIEWSSKFDPQLGVVMNKRNAPMAKEKEIEMYFLAVGKRMRLPKEVMLDAMRYFEETAISWAETVRANMPLLAAAKTPAERLPFEQAIEFAETRVREHILMAVDVAYKAAPYVHPRLAAMITTPGSGDSPLNAIATLFRELDEAGRPPAYIDHDANEVAK